MFDRSSAHESARSPLFALYALSWCAGSIPGSIQRTISGFGCVEIDITISIAAMRRLVVARP
jgi:hypothetical protein